MSAVSFLLSDERGFPATFAPCPPIPLDAIHGGPVALLTQFRLILVPPGHEPFGYLEPPLYHLPALISAVGHGAVSSPNTNGECCVDPSVARKTVCEVIN